jgi:hypothetical protein
VGLGPFGPDHDVLGCPQYPGVSIFSACALSLRGTVAVTGNEGAPPVAAGEGWPGPAWARTGNFPGRPYGFNRSQLRWKHPPTIRHSPFAIRQVLIAPSWD